MAINYPREKKKRDTAYFYNSEIYICMMFICKLYAVHGKDLKLRHNNNQCLDFRFIKFQGHIIRSRIK